MRSTQTLKDMANSLISYLTTTKIEEPPAEEMKKLSRSRTAFSANKTASLALPGRDIKIKKAKKTPKSKYKKKSEKTAEKKAAQEQKLTEEKNEKKTEITNPNSSMLYYLLSLIPALAPPKITPKEEKKDECSKTLTPQKPVTTDIELLEAQVKELETMRTLKDTLRKIQDKTKESKKQADSKSLIAEIEQLDVAIDAINLQKVELVAEQIQEHARRRVDLFFYLLLVVRGKQVTIQKDTTVKQHGNGSTVYGTHACHSSLFPNLKFAPLKSNSMLSWIKTPVSLSLAGTQFEEVLNMTVELPKIVNQFDGHLEVVPLGKYRFRPTTYVKNCLELLNKVAASEMDIQVAMHEFFKIMHEFFSKYQPRSQAEKKIWEYEHAGTFIAANKDLTLKDEYLYLMLRLDSRNPAEIKKETKDSSFSVWNLYSHEVSEIEKVKNNPKLLPNYYQRMQNEILTPLPPGPEVKRRRVRENKI